MQAYCCKSICQMSHHCSLTNWTLLKKVPHHLKFLPGASCIGILACFNLPKMWCLNSENLGIACNVHGIKWEGRLFWRFYKSESVEVVFPRSPVWLCMFMLSFHECPRIIHLYKPFWSCNEPDDLQTAVRMIAYNFLKSLAHRCEPLFLLDSPAQEVLMDMDWSSRLLVCKAWMYHSWIKALQFSTVGITLTRVKAQALSNDRNIWAIVSYSIPCLELTMQIMRLMRCILCCILYRY